MPAFDDLPAYAAALQAQRKAVRRRRKRARRASGASSRIARADAVPTDGASFDAVPFDPALTGAAPSRIGSSGGIPSSAPPPRRSPTQRRGDRAEAAALALLQDAGLVLLARNLACRAGELDLVMRDGDVLVFVEVRARSSARYGGAAASVGVDKQRRLQRAAARFLPVLARRHWSGALPRCRFDVIALEADGPLWLRGAFGQG